MDLKVDPNEATHAQDLTVDGCVCPQCYRPLKAPAVTEGGADRYGRRTRSYAGMCFHCRQGCRVIQFDQDGKWLIQSFMPPRYQSGKFVSIGPDWIEVNPLPEPPAVLTGPGGDFDKAVDLDALGESLTGQTLNLINAMANALNSLLNSHRNRQRNGPDKRKH